MVRQGIGYLNFTYDFQNLFCLFSSLKKGWAKTIIVSIFQWSIVSAVGIRLAGEIMVFYMHMDRRDAWLEITCLFLNSLSTITRIIFLKLKRESVFKIMYHWEEMFVRNPLIKANVKKVRQKIRRMDIFMKILILLTVLSYLHWILNPNFGPGDGGRKLPLKSWYPYDMYASPNYEITFAFQAFVALVSVYSMFGVQGFFITVCVLAKFQVRELQGKLVSIGKSGRGRMSIEQPREKRRRKMERRLVECVQHHRLIRRFIQEIDELFGYVILIDFLQLAAVMCLTTVEATYTNLTESRSLAWLEYLLISLQQLFLCCWSANEVTVQMKRLTIAVTEAISGYITNEMRWNLNFMVLHCSGEVLLTGGGFIILSIDTFTKMIGLVLSNYVVLRQLRESRKQ